MMEWPEYWLNNPASRTVKELKQACAWAVLRIKQLEGNMTGKELAEYNEASKKLWFEEYMK